MMIGPAPMMRMLLRSVRLGILLSLFVSLHECREAIEEVADVVRAGRSLRMALEAERGLVDAGEALERVVEQAYVRGTQVGRQALLVDRESVVLAGDADATVVQVLDRMVRAVVAELHLEGLRPRGQRHDLVAKADAENRD